MVMKIINLIALIIMIAHWNGCLHFFVPMLQEFPEDCWVIQSGLINESWFTQYTASIFKATSHMLGTGYGTYTPRTVTEMWLSIFTTCSGAIVYAISIAQVSSVIQNFDSSSKRYNIRLQEIQEYMISRKLPKKLKKKVIDYMDKKYHEKIFDESSILEELSPQLKQDIMNFNCQGLITKAPFMETCGRDPLLIQQIVSNLKYLLVQPSDVIIHEGAYGDKMYFIRDGIVEVFNSTGKIITTLSNGSYFGEICLLAKSKRTASVRAITYCHLYSLSAEEFYKALNDFPQAKLAFEEAAHDRLQETQNSYN